MAATGASPDRASQQAAQEAARLVEAAREGAHEVVRRLEELRGREEALALAAVSALGRERDPAAARALAAVAESELAKDLRKEARRGLHRLRAVGVEVPSLAPATAALPVAAPVSGKVYEAWASAPDGSGSRGLWLLVERPLGGILVFALIVNDVVGLQEARVYESTKKKFQRRLAVMRDEGAEWVPLPPEYARQLVGEALSLNRRTGFAVPHEFQVHREQAEHLEAPFESALVYREISPGAARLAPDWLEQGARLLEERELADWLLPFEAIEPFAQQMREVQGGGLLVNPLASPERQEQLVGEAISRILDPDLRQALKRRLEETAYVLLRTERPHLARSAVATALALEEAGTSRLLIQQPGRQLEQIPFLRALTLRSIELAQHVAETGHVGEYPRGGVRG